MGVSKVVVVPCDSYDDEAVYSCMKAGIDALGGIGCFVRQEDRILVKPNFLTPAEADKGISTHPAVIRGMLRILSEAGYPHVSFGDSPGHGSSRNAVARLGLNEDNVFGATIADMSEEVTVQFPEGVECREFHFAREIAEADAIINLCKMKTHMLERITGAVKNVYGFICGHRKAAGHVKYPNDTIFARMLTDIHKCRRPVLNIMDGIMAMEGNGPSGGDMVPMKVMLFSTDPVALDAVYCRLIDLDPELVPTCSQGRELGIGTDRYEDIEMILCEKSGESGSDDVWSCSMISALELFDRFGNAGFKVSRNAPPRSLLSRFSKIMTAFARKPHIDASKCVRCGICVQHCPVPGKAVDFVNGRDHVPQYDYSKCIRCYCCQEMCPQHAIRAK